MELMSLLIVTVE